MIVTSSVVESYRKLANELLAITGKAKSNGTILTASSIPALIV